MNVSFLIYCFFGLIFLYFVKKCRLWSDAAFWSGSALLVKVSCGGHKATSLQGIGIFQRLEWPPLVEFPCNITILSNTFFSIGLNQWPYNYWKAYAWCKPLVHCKSMNSINWLITLRRINVLFPRQKESGNEDMQNCAWKACQVMVLFKFRQSDHSLLWSLSE